MDFEEMAGKCPEWTSLARNRGQKLMALLKTAMKRRLTLREVQVSEEESA
jgi:hypothetical protein